MKKEIRQATKYEIIQNINRFVLQFILSLKNG